MRTWAKYRSVGLLGPARVAIRMAVIAAAAVSGMPAFGQTSASSRPSEPETPALHFLVVDDSVTPHVRVTWQDVSGRPVVLEADRPYQSPNERSVLGGNLECFVALGGTRLDKQAGDPDGAIVRIGLYKVDAAKPMFEGVANDSTIEVVLSKIRFDKPAIVRPETGVQHVKYSPEALAECGLTGAAFELYNTVSPTDTLRGSITPENGRLGALSTDGASFEIREGTDGTYSMVARIPYRLLRHVQDPWHMSVPGTFLEPLHFHLEYEAVPAVRTSSHGDPVPEPDAAPGSADDPAQAE